MKFVKIILIIFLNILMLYIFVQILQNPHEEYYNKSDVSIYSKGNADLDTRAAILQQLHKFQEGYTKRDTSLITSYMSLLI